MPAWLRSKKFWSTILAATVMVAHNRLGISQEAATTAAYALVSGAGIEGVIDGLGVILNRRKGS